MAVSSPGRPYVHPFFVCEELRKEKPLKPEEHVALEASPEIERRREFMEIHLFDDNAAEERALCGADTSDDCIRSVKFYLEDRLHGADVGTVCEGCKKRAVPLAQAIAQDPEAEGLLDDAAEYRELVATLLRETDRDLQGD